MVAPQQPLQDFLAELLAEQGRLETPAALASRAYDQSRIENRESKISSLIPLSKPGPGEQYAFEVDLDSCSGCKACVVACHALNGLEENESWRDVGLVHGGSRADSFQQTITTACHHCADPGCLNGCPVLAYEKDPVTGIVRHLDDQCIGCQYCVLKCPYDVPKYSERLGIVRKCDMCHNRLADGEAPACVQACPTQAIKIVKVELHVAPVVRADTSRFLSVAPAPSYTQPTTRYLSRQPLPANAAAADAAALRPQPPHWPLVVMLTLLPMAVGCQAVAAILGTDEPGKRVTYYITLFGWVAGAAGLGASVFHLGQPLRAWRIFLGWRKSWLSREAMVFGAWFGAATGTNLVANGWSPVPLPLTPLLAVTALLGLAGLVCSVMIYVDTHREFWRLAQTGPRFLGTALVLGLAGALAAGGPPWVGLALMLATVMKLALEARALAPLREPDVDHVPSPARQTARLLTGPLLAPVNAFRVCAALAGGILVPLMSGATSTVVPPAWLALAFLLPAELAERYLFFRAVDAPKMPGSVRS